MLKIIGIILMVGVGIMLIKLFFSFIIAFFTFTIGAFYCTGPILLILNMIGVLESDTASALFWGAMGIGFVCDIVRFITDPGKRFSDTAEIFNSKWDTPRGSNTGHSHNDSDNYRYQDDQYRKCCGSCKWLSGHSSSYDVCTLNGREVSHSDYCGDWQPE